MISTEMDWQPILQCRRCSQQWLRRKMSDLPKQCPKCHSPYWNCERVNGSTEGRGRKPARRLVPALTPEQLDRFWNKVNKRGPDECWFWLAGRDHLGYGRIQLYPHGGFGAHRVSFVLHGGDPTTPSVMHKCDCPPCVNPNHLVGGTHLDNMRDACAKGRRPKGATHPYRKDPSLAPRGEQIGRSALTELQVAEIRRLYASGNISQKQLAIQFGVGKGCIYWVLHGLTWKHIKGEIPITPMEYKLTPESVVEMRQLRIAGWTLLRLANKFGVTEPVAQKVVKGQLWKHVAPELTRKSRKVDGQSGSRLTLEAIRGIRAMYDKGVLRREIAAYYGVCLGTVVNIGTRQTLGHIKENFRSARMRGEGLD